MNTTAPTTATPPWQTRRLAHIEKALRDVDQATKKGTCLQKALRDVAATYNGRCLGGGHFLKLSRKSLERYWYRTEGPAGVARLRLHFGGPRKTRIPQYARYLCTYLAVAEGLSVPALYARLQSLGTRLPFSLDTLRRAVPAAALARLRDAADAAQASTARLTIERTSAMEAHLSTFRASCTGAGTHKEKEHAHGNTRAKGCNTDRC